MVLSIRPIRRYASTSSVPCPKLINVRFPGMLASLTRELHFHQERLFWVRPVTLAPHLAHLARFTNVATLVLSNFVPSAFHATSILHCFGSFAARVHHLRLHCPIARPTSLVQIILLFPAVTDIEIQSPQWGLKDENEVLVPPPQGGPRFTGTLNLRGFGERWSPFFVILSAQPLEFRKTRFIGCEFGTPTPTQSLLEAVSHSTRTLHLVGFGNRELGCGSCRGAS